MPTMEEMEFKYTKSKRARNFIQALEKVYREFDLSLSHEDSQGAFIIEKYSKYNVSWLRQAHERMEDE